MKKLAELGLALLAALAIVGLLVWWYGVRDGTDTPGSNGRSDGANWPSAELLARGAYLARAGNCMLCHTRRGGAAYAGGRAIETPFGTVFSSNLTPDVASGIGSWSTADFWRALHHGRSRDGRLLVPAFPYTSYAQVTREDVDAIFAFLQNQPAVAQPNPPQQLRWPYNTQLALAVWRALYFRPELFQPDPGHDLAWNRGAYLVRALGHCNACHTTRNLLGAEDSKLDLAGGPIPMQNWYAPSLLLASEAGVADWDIQQVVRLLQTGMAPRGTVTGPMAEVVQHSTQFLTRQDLIAMASYLKALPAAAGAVTERPQIPNPGSAAGAKLYERHCAQCHGDKGEGVAGAYPALAGNRAVSMPPATNLVQMVLRGGFAPATDANPRPYGMPPYQMVLSDSELAALLTHIRGAWGNRAGAVSELDVTRYRVAR